MLIVFKEKEFLTPSFWMLSVFFLNFGKGVRLFKSAVNYNEIL